MGECVCAVIRHPSDRSDVSGHLHVCVSLQSISYTDWLNSVVTADSFGDLIFAVLPHISYGPQYVKRTLERRFVRPLPLFFSVHSE